MQGYLGEADLTREAPLDGWLRTSDLAYRDPEGCLYLAGRLFKEIIKCAGERISPSEIEDVLSVHPSVLEVAVIGRPDPLLGEAVWAYVVPRLGAGDAAELRRHCAERLSPHKLSRRYIFLAELPRTATGKVKKGLLSEG